MKSWINFATVSSYSISKRSLHNANKYSFIALDISILCKKDERTV